MKKPNTIIITGAAGTIGQATAEILNQQGFHLVLADKNINALIKLTSHISNSSTILVDVTNPIEMTELFNSVANELTGVVMCASIEGPIGPIEECTDINFQTVMTTNVMSVFLGIKHALRVLKPKKRGSIVVLSSISGITGMPMLSSYSASKHAVMGLVKSTAREAASHGIRINAVCPGPVTSKMMDRIDSEMVALFPNRPNASSSIPMQRYATPTEVAKMIAFLCSDASEYCTGSTMTIDGGLTCK